MPVKHHDGCSPHYPEKPLDELPQELFLMRLEDGSVIRQCVDCGAFDRIDPVQELSKLMGRDLRARAPFFCVWVEYTDSGAERIEIDREGFLHPDFERLVYGFDPAYVEGLEQFLEGGRRMEEWAREWQREQLSKM